ncbi:DNA-binding GntR family transcriptional regulator [Mesorhizobium shonense]|uniref:DNA-binding GntR family transcriptional regulator n=1 Tax=Mesorhizobium shonense TaxID=1209948 RepID=A0ABV2HVW8_9HYPH
MTDRVQHIGKGALRSMASKTSDSISSQQTKAAEHKLVEFLESASLTRAIPLRDQVYTLIRKAIVTGKLAPGAFVNEIEIAMKLRMSRTPVREALKKLSDEGLIEVFPQTGTFVSKINRKQMEEAYIIRVALELQSIKRAAAMIETSQIQDLEDIINAHETAVKRSRIDEAIAWDDDFHRYIAEVNGLTMLWKAIDVSKAVMDRCGLLALTHPSAGQEAIAQHRSIHEALAKHDQAGSMKALQTHLETSLRNTIAGLGAETVTRIPGDVNR